MTRTGDTAIQNHIASPIRFRTCNINLKSLFSIQRQFAKNAFSLAPHSFILPALKQNGSAAAEKQRKERKKERSLTFFLLEGVRHDGICSGNQEAVWRLEFKAVSPVQVAKGGLFCRTKSLFSGASHRDQSTLLPDSG